MKVCTDLAASPWRVSTGGITYHFSTEIHKDRFVERLENYRADVRQKLSKRYRVAANIPLLADICLYRLIENRGFYIECKEGVYTWPEQVELSGGQLTSRDCGQLSESSTQS